MHKRERESTIAVPVEPRYPYLTPKEERILTSDRYKYIPPLPPHQAPYLDFSVPNEKGPLRRKIKIQFLEEDPQRRSTFKKRRKGIIKKAEELHILCGVDTCAIIYGLGESEPKVWPNIVEVARVCKELKKLPELEGMRLMRTHVHFLEDFSAKKGQQLWQQHDELSDIQLKSFIYGGIMGNDTISTLPRLSLIRLHFAIQTMLHERYKRCTKLRGVSSTINNIPLVNTPQQGSPTLDSSVDTSTSATNIDTSLEATTEGIFFDKSDM